MNRYVMPLVRTPPPFKYESLKGFILRSSETNGYSTPTMMLSSAGMSNGEMISAVPPLDILAPLFDLKLSEIVKLGYRKPTGKPSSKNVWIYNHQLPTFYLNIKCPKICTECILEKGFIESFWDLKYAIACPKHSKLLLKICPECNKQLSWFRPGLLTCVCGSDLSPVKGVPLNNAPVLGLLSFMRNQLLGQPHDVKLLEISLGFPVDHLSRLTLIELLSVITRLENKIVHSNSFTSDQHEQILLAKASNALENWPEGFFKYLDSFNNERTSTEGFGLRKQFESFCGSLFKTKISQEKIAFIKEAFIQYGNHYWKKGYVFNNQSNSTKVVGIYGLADVLGVMPSTAKSLVKKGLITGKASNLNGRTRQFFDVEHQLPFKAATGKTLTLRKAAAWLGLPASILKVLREQQNFLVMHIAKPFSAYHMNDLVVFRDKILNSCSVNKNIIIDEHVTLKQVMQFKVGSTQIKANFVKAILVAELIPQGNIDGSVKGMFFSKLQLEEFIGIQRATLFGYSRVVNAAKELHCDPLVVKSLAESKLLIAIKQTNGIFIQNVSIKEFGSRYVSCASIAREKNTSSPKILEHCVKKNIVISWFPRYGKNNPQPFVDYPTAKLEWALSK